MVPTSPDNRGSTVTHIIISVAVLQQLLFCSCSVNLPIVNNSVVKDFSFTTVFFELRNAVARESARSLDRFLLF